MPHVLVQLQYFSLLEEEQLLCMKPTRAARICEVRITRSNSSIFAQNLLSRNLTKFIQGKCKYLHLRRKFPGNWYMLWATQVESSLAEKGLGSCQCVFVANVWNVPWAALGAVLPADQGCHPSPLLNTTTPWVLCPAVGPLVHKSHRHTKESPAKGHEDDESTGILLWEMA